MGRRFGIFKKLNLSLRTEVIINISILMLAAILLVGFTISKVDEKFIIQEVIKNGEGIIQNLQMFIDLSLRDKKGLDLNNPFLKKDIQDFFQNYIEGKGINHFVITDKNQKIIFSSRKELIEKILKNPYLTKSIKSGLIHTEIEREGWFLLNVYRNLIIYAPFLVEGEITGGIQLVISLGKMMNRHFESQKIILLLILIDAIVLIAFGNFLISRIFVKPLRELAHLTERISQGDLNQNIEVTSENEIGRLIASFNRMIERLKENQERIKNHLESLEQANQKLKKVQEELIRTEKLASIGRFAAGVAHEVGNPLGSIIGYTAILGQEGIGREEAKEYLKRIEKEIERINRIVRELLNFARPSKFEVHDVDINKVIENTLSLLSYQKDFKNIKTEIELQKNLPIIKGDESQISQVLINIILNAVDAMPKGGLLKIKTEEYVVERWPSNFTMPRRKDDPLEADYSHLRGPDPISKLFKKFSKGDKLIKISIADTGIGIKDGDLEKIFDPFFTTKDPDKGTGLGLSISLRIVESLGGEIKVESHVGKGTTFSIYFPVMIDKNLGG